MNMPALVDAKTMERSSKGFLHPIELSAKCELSSVSALTAVLPFDESVSPLEWVSFTTPDGVEAKYRAYKVENAYGKQKRVTFLHGICTLGDTTINGNGKISGTFGEIVSELLDMQEKTNWKLWNVEVTETEEIEYYNDNLLDLLLEVQSLFKDYAFQYDMSTYPWKINIVKLPQNNGCHGRFSRNLDSLTISILQDNLCTRVKVDGKDGYTDADTVSKYGIVSKVVYIPEGATEAQAKRYVDRYLENYKEPVVSIRLDAMDLSRVTGEAFDAYKLGKLCRCHLPDDGIEITNRVVTIEYPDLLRFPEKMYVSLNRKTPTLRDIIVEQKKQQRKSSGAGRSKQEKKNKEFSDLIYNAYIDIDKNRGNIDLYVEKLNLLTQEKDELEIKLDAKIETITIRATELQEDIEKADARIAVNAREIALRVKEGELISSINQTAETIQIQASKINLSGYVTASQLAATNATISNLTSGVTTANALKASLVAGTTVSGDYGRFDYIYHGGHAVSRKSLQVSTPSGSTTIYYLAYTP